MTFEQKYLSIFNIVKNEIEQVSQQMTDDINIQEPLKSKVFDLLNAPSKHIRPVVSFLYLKACNIDVNYEQILYQSAIELVHNASLIHDDIIDESNIRRNIKSINGEFGNKLAVLAGDYLLSIALDKVLKIDNTELIQIFSDTLKIMSCGEISQQYSKFKIPTLDEYILKSEQKTARLFETALLGSLKIAQAKKYFIQGKNFAKNFGIAFQIRDDLINAKTTKTDIKEGIYTAPVIFSESTEINQDSLEKTQTLLNNYIDKTACEIENFEESEYKTALNKLLKIL